MIVNVDKRLNRHWKLFVCKWSLLLLLAVVACRMFFSWGTMEFTYDAGLGAITAAVWFTLRSNENMALFLGNYLASLVLLALVLVTSNRALSDVSHSWIPVVDSLLVWMPVVSMYFALIMYDRRVLLILILILFYVSSSFFELYFSDRIGYREIVYNISISVVESAVIVLFLLSFMRIHFAVVSRKYQKKGETIVSQKDQLTNLFTRSVFEEALQQNAQVTSRSEVTFSLVLIGIDKFKEYDAEYGHATGDEALRAIAQIISARIRKADIACRWGGDVFAIIFPLTSIQGAMIIAKSLRAEVEKHAASQGRPLTVSIGVCEQMKNEYPGATFQRADNALKLAKQRGPNQIVASGPTVFAWEETHFYT